MVGLAYTASAADKHSSSECEHMVYGCCAALSCTRTSYQHMITHQSCESHIVSLSGDCRYRHVTVCTLLSCKSSSMAHPQAVHSMYPDGTCASHLDIKAGCAVSESRFKANHFSRSELWYLDLL